MTTWYCAGPALRKQASDEEWSHGSQRLFNSFYDKYGQHGDPDTGEWDDTKHWNTHIGPHFTSDHDVAEHFADKDSHYEDGHIYHVNLKMKNPKHYGSEFDMDKEAYEHAKKHGIAGSMDDVPVGARGPAAHQRAIRESDDPVGIAHAFKQHLIDQGHDGITYGNEYEGPKGHKCAVPFHPHQVEITYHHRSGYEACDPPEESQQSQQTKDYGKVSSLDLTEFFRQAANAEDELPPEPGTAPIPDGHIRLYHYTRPEHLPSIREHGLLESHARGDGGMGAGNEPSAGVWASTQPPKDAPNFVEFHAHPDEISDRAESTRGYTPEEFQKGNHHVIMRGDVKPHQIVNIHEKWHDHARFILGDPKALADTKRGANDHAMEFPDYAKAITHVKKHGSAERYTHNTSPSLRSSIQEHGLKPGRQAFPEEHEHLEDWESAGDADSLWLHKDRGDKAIAGHDTWGVTHPHLYDIQKGEDADEGTNYYRTDDTIAPEHLHLLHQGQSKTAGGPLIFYPAKHGGKYHLTDSLSETARCRGTVEVDKSGDPIHVTHDQEKVHPIICKRCLDSGRAAQSQGKQVAGSLSPEYRFEHEENFNGDHRIDAFHHSGEHAGHAEFDRDGSLAEIHTNADHRRRGVATGMWEHAKSIGINPQHSNVRTEMGDVWAESTGDDVPPNLYPSSPWGDPPHHIENRTFSTAFTAPGYHHPYTSGDMPHALGYEPRNPHRAALHDISMPQHSYDDWGHPEEEKEKNRQAREKDNEEFHSKIREEAGLPEDTPRYESENHWKRGMAHALTTGQKTIDEAEAQGYRGDNREHGDKISTYENYYDKVKPRRGGYQNLAAHQSHFFHVGTDSDAIKNEGLKTRREQGTNVGHGLGGGSDDTVSVTDDHDLATDIYHALHEHHAVVTGKITPQQLYDYAKNPPKGEPFHHQLVKPGSVQEEDFDRLKRGVVKNGYTNGGPQEWAHPDDISDEHKAEGWKPSGNPVSGPNHPRHPTYEHFERPATEEEQARGRSEFYKNFSTYRHFAGGHRDPLFISNDPVKFAKSDPDKFGVLNLKPHPKAQGYPLDPNKGHHDRADSGEWRIGPGSPFDVDGVDKPSPRHEEEFANYPATKKSDHGKVAMLFDAAEFEAYYQKTAATEPAYRGMVLSHGGRDEPEGYFHDPENVMKHMRSRKGAEGNPLYGAYWTRDKEQAKHFSTGTHSLSYVWGMGLTRDKPVHGVVLEAHIPHREHQDDDSPFLYPSEQGVLGPYRQDKPKIRAHVYRLDPDKQDHEQEHLHSFDVPDSHWSKTASISDTSDECHCASCNSLGMIPPGSDCTARKTAVAKGGVWYHGTDADTAAKVREQGDFSGYENKAKGSRVWGKGVYMAKDPKETARFGENQVAVSHGMKNPFVLKHEHGFPGPYTVVRQLSPESQDVFDEQHASFSATARPGSGGNSAGEALRMALQHEGHDGVIFPGDNDTDWAVNYHPENVKVHRQDKTAATRDVRDADSDAGAQTGIMVAIVPPKSIVKNLAVADGEAPEQMHITLAYLGDTSDYDDDLVANLPEIIEEWAAGTAKFPATTQGAGTFVKAEEDGQHVLWAAVDAPGLHLLHAGLVDYLKGHGFDPKQDHSFTPHITLAYGKHHFRFIPKVERQEWTCKEVWCCIGGIWKSYPLRGRAKTASLDLVEFFSPTG